MRHALRNWFYIFYKQLKTRKRLNWVILRTDGDAKDQKLKLKGHDHDFFSDVDVYKASVGHCL